MKSKIIFLRCFLRMIECALGFGLLSLGYHCTYASSPSSYASSKAVIKAVSSNDIKTLEQILKNGGNANAKDHFGDSALHLASLYGYDTIVSLLLKNGAKVNEVDEMTLTPLDLSVWPKRHPTTLKLLIQAGANIDDTSDGYTPLWWAVNWGNEDCVSALLQYKANVNKSGKPGSTPLMEAAQGGVQRLLPHHAPIPIADQETCLRIAKRLIAAGADPNLTDGKGRTAIFYAVQVGFEKIVRLLMISGANPNVRDKKGITPASMARRLPWRQRLPILKDLHRL